MTSFLSPYNPDGRTHNTPLYHTLPLHNLYTLAVAAAASVVGPGFGGRGTRDTPFIRLYFSFSSLFRAFIRRAYAAITLNRCLRMGRPIIKPRYYQTSQKHSVLRRRTSPPPCAPPASPPTFTPDSLFPIVLCCRVRAPLF